jgi:acyl-CoA-binding protein
MSDETGEFEKAAKAAKALPQRPDDQTLLQL